MQQTPKSFSLWLLASLIVGAAIGAYLAVQWKESQAVERIAAAVETEKARHAPAYAKVAELEQELERARLEVELADVAMTAEAKNFGIAHDRLVEIGEDLRAWAAAAGRTGDLEPIFEQQAEILADLEALDPKAAVRLRQLFTDVRNAFSR